MLINCRVVSSDRRVWRSTHGRKIASCRNFCNFRTDSWHIRWSFSFHLFWKIILIFAFSGCLAILVPYSCTHFVWGTVRFVSVIVCIFLCFCSFSSPRGNFPIQSYSTLSCDHGLHCSDKLMWEQQQPILSCLVFGVVVFISHSLPLLEVYYAIFFVSIDTLRMCLTRRTGESFVPFSEKVPPTIREVIFPPFLLLFSFFCSSFPFSVSIWTPICFILFFCSCGYYVVSSVHVATRSAFRLQWVPRLKRGMEQAESSYLVY